MLIPGRTEGSRIVVTGAGGQLGSAVCRTFSEHQETMGLTRADLDVRDAEAVQAALTDLRPNVVVHCAAFTDVDGAESRPDEAFATNTNGAEAVARATEAAGGALVYISTDYVFSGDQRTPYVETDPPEPPAARQASGALPRALPGDDLARERPLGGGPPLSVYAQSKLEGERRCQAACSRLWIVRTCGLYSVEGKNFPKAILERAKALRLRSGQAGETLRVVDDQTVGAPTYAPDLAEALLRLVTEAPYGIYHLTNQGVCTWFEFARTLLDLAGHGDVSLAPITSAELVRPARRPAYSVLANRAWEALGFEPLRHYEEALRDFMREVASIP